jgi:hypothetical protein
MSAVYTSIMTAKTGLPVPVFANGHTMHSRYDPEKEAAQAASSITGSCLFFLIAGVGGGYLLKNIRTLYPHSTILAAENSTDDIEFLKIIPTFAELCSDEQTIIFPVEKTAEKLQQYYLPGVYGSMQIIEQKSWTVENLPGIAEFRKQAETASKAIAADFSVQVHFGRIWQRNIIMNLSQVYTHYLQYAFPVKKTALIAAAGPSLDLTISYILENRKSLYVVATDTAYSSLVKRNIHCDVVVSIDGQEVSHNHFMAGKLSDDTLFVFDLCANPAAVRTARQHGCRVLFIQTGHPLSLYASSYSIHNGKRSFPPLESGAGTVTMAAVDFAAKAGFSSIIAAGADFSYLNGKAYMKGTYLDMLYNCRSIRTATSETLYDGLLFRTKLFPYKNHIRRFTTGVLESYEASFKKWIDEYGNEDGESNFLKFCKVKQETVVFQSAESFDLTGFIKQFRNDFSAVKFDTLLPGRFPPVLLSLLPCVSSFRYTGNKEMQDFKELANLAYSEILRYTETI